jgi:replicative DNA helicase
MAFDTPAKEIEGKSDSWNVADGYTKLKILKPLVEMDKLLKIAIYGAENIEETFQLMQFPEMRTMIRIEALNRMIDVLRETIENSRFALKKEGKEVLDELQRRVFLVRDVLPAIHTEQIDMRTNQKSIVINEEHFLICLEELRDIKQSIPEPLNKSGLIFPTSDEIDLSRMKEELIEGG